MGYDISITSTVPTQVHADHCSFNLRPLFVQLFGDEGILGLHGKTGREVETPMRAAVLLLKYSPSRYHGLLPLAELDCALDVLDGLGKAAHLHPNGVVRITP